MPIRVQRKRTKGWKMPENTVYVGRGSRWGNPFPTHEYERDGHGDKTGRKVEVRSPEEAVNFYANWLLPYRHHGPTSNLESFYLSEANLRDIKEELCGKNLACWCPLGKPCHADVLLEIANTPQPHEQTTGMKEK